MILDTQIDAFESLDISKRRSEVLFAIKTSDGITLFELAKKLGWTINRVSGRVTELARMNLIYDSAIRRMNPNSGRRSVVWRIK